VSAGAAGRHAGPPAFGRQHTRIARQRSPRLDRVGAVQSLVESGQLAGTKGSYRLVKPVDEIAVPPRCSPSSRHASTAFPSARSRWSGARP
jgi:hypothetical protein